MHDLGKSGVIQIGIGRKLNLAGRDVPGKRRGVNR
jgi:hypothetical protein